MAQARPARRPRLLIRATLAGPAAGVTLAAEAGARGVILMPRSSIEMSIPSSGLLWPGFGFSILISGFVDSFGALGGLGGVRGSSTISVTVQLNSGSDWVIAEMTINSIDSRKKRFQLMPTSQLA